MRVYKTRPRMISIRLSEEEYAGLKRLCSLTGARSVSDLARDAMNLFLKNGTTADGLSARMDEFRISMRAIERKIDELPTKLAASARGSVNAASTRERCA